MLRIDAWQSASPGTSPLPPYRNTLPTVPCDLEEYAQAETGPLSWSAVYDEAPPALELNEPFDMDGWPEL
jgi:hypothetical protein